MRATRPRRKTLVRRLALAKLRELKRQGLTYRQIGHRFGALKTHPVPDHYRHRLPPERLLACGAEAEGSIARKDGHSPGTAGDDAQLFVRALDALDQGLAFFGEDGEMLCANAALTELVEDVPEGDGVRAELTLFAAAVWRLARLRKLEGVESVEEMAVQEVPSCPVPIVMKGSYIGLDLFGAGPSMLISVERQTDPLSPQVLRRRFSLTDRECNIAQLLARGRSNAEIANELTLSPHTARRHTENVLRKLRVHSRSEAAARLLSSDEEWPPPSAQDAEADLGAGTHP